MSCSTPLVIAIAMTRAMTPVATPRTAIAVTTEMNRCLRLALR